MPQSTALTAHITQVSKGSSSWSFLYEDSDGLMHFFHLDPKEGFELCHELLDLAKRAAREVGIDIPIDFPRISLLSCLHVEVSTNPNTETPIIHPVALGFERLQELLEEHFRGGAPKI